MKMFWKVLFALATLALATSGFAEEAATAAAQVPAAAAGIDSKALVQMAYMIGLGLAVIGGALGEGKVAAAALEGIARNPSAAGKLQMIMILGLALIESLVIFALISKFI